MIATLLMALSMGAGAASASEPRAVVQAMFDAFNRHDAAAMARLYAPNAELTSPDFCSTRRHADVERTYRDLFTAFPDIHDRVDVMIVEGDRVAVRFVAVSAIGDLRLNLQSMLEVQGGLIVGDHTLFDAGGRPCSN